jgi:hypothetical protein
MGESYLLLMFTLNVIKRNSGFRGESTATCVMMIKCILENLIGYHREQDLFFRELSLYCRQFCRGHKKIGLDIFLT